MKEIGNALIFAEIVTLWKGRILKVLRQIKDIFRKIYAVVKFMRRTTAVRFYCESRNLTFIPSTCLLPCKHTNRPVRK